MAGEHKVLHASAPQIRTGDAKPVPLLFRTWLDFGDGRLEADDEFDAVLDVMAVETLHVPLHLVERPPRGKTMPQKEKLLLDGEAPDTSDGKDPADTPFVVLVGHCHRDMPLLLAVT